MKTKGLLLILALFLGGIGAVQDQKSYGFKINDVEITSGSVGKMSEIKGVTVGKGGHITYNHTARTLSLKHVSLVISGLKECLNTRTESGELWGCVKIHFCRSPSKVFHNTQSLHFVHYDTPFRFRE